MKNETPLTTVTDGTGSREPRSKVPAVLLYRSTLARPG